MLDLPKTLLANKRTVIDLNRFFIIAGPCVIESYEHLKEVATHINHITKKMGIQWVLKASYDKANRTKIDSFRGPGIGRGISTLHKVKSLLNCPITTDFHTVEELQFYGTTVDLVQIPAFLSRQTDLLVAAAQTGRPVNVKKGQFVGPGAIADIRHKLRASGCKKCLITERGTQFGHDDVVVDFRNIEYIDVLDVTHTVKRWIDSLALAKAGVAAGANIFCEVGSTKCDAGRSIPLDQFEDFMESICDWNK